jgi:hypothetical protein
MVYASKPIPIITTITITAINFPCSSSHSGFPVAEGSLGISSPHIILLLFTLREFDTVAGDFASPKKIQGLPSFAPTLRAGKERLPSLTTVNRHLYISRASNLGVILSVHGILFSDNSIQRFCGFDSCL